MTSELRWVLLLIGVVFITALSVWERRRPRQASASSATERPSARDLVGEGAPRTRHEPKLTLPEIPAAPHGGTPLPVIEFEDTEESGELPVLEPVAASFSDTYEEYAADELRDDEADEEVLAAQPTPVARAAGPAPAARPAADAFAYVRKIEPLPATPAAPLRDALPELPPAAPLVVEWPPDEKRRIVALRLVCPQPQRFPGRSLRQALSAEGFVLGRFAIFHKPDEERRAVLSAASLNRPGTFDADTMDTQQYGGLSLFAVLPGPKPPSQAFDELVFAARSLNERLQGVLQDEQGGPLTPARIATLRERLQSGAAS